jgi:phage anti-repressor protein
MEQLIKIQTNANGTKAISAFELYEKLGFSLKNFDRWKTKNITENEYAIYGVDWCELALNEEQNGFNSSFVRSKADDVTLSIDFGKRLAMLARTEAGEMVRKYFVAVEKAAIQKNNTMLLYKMREIEQKIDEQQEIKNKANEELRFLNKWLKNTKEEIYGQLPEQTPLSNYQQIKIAFTYDADNIRLADSEVENTDTGKI